MRIPEDLYRRILRSIPIPCVDLLIFDSLGKVLLVRRSNEPCQGQWWFPGGRVYFGETREEAAQRKLSEECGLEAETVRELSTLDVILPIAPGPDACHAITTLFAVTARDRSAVRLDAQSSDFAWKTPDEWHREGLHPFVHEGLVKFAANAMVTHRNPPNDQL